MKDSDKQEIFQKIQNEFNTSDQYDYEKVWDYLAVCIFANANIKEKIQFIQRILQVEDDGIDGPITWNTLKNFILPNSSLVESDGNEDAVAANKNSLSDNSMKLILDYEVGGGESYYNKYLKKPTWPKGASGVTIGIGYDLGYNSAADFERDWAGKISSSDFNRLKNVLGYKGNSASRLTSSVSDIQIPWDAALQVFKEKTIPRFIDITLQTFPNADKLHPDAFGALVSLVFNRGGSLKGDSRREMARIRELVKIQDYQEIAQQIRNMKRLWVGKGLDGLLKRRDREAQIIQNCA